MTKSTNSTLIKILQKVLQEGGGVSSGSNSIGNIGDLELGSKIVENASEKIKKLAKQIKKFLDDTIKIVKKYEPLLKGIGAGFLTAFGFKWVGGAVKKFLAMKGITLIIGAIKKALLTAITVFSLTGNPLKALVAGFGSLTSSLMSFLKNLTPMQKFQVSLVALVATFVTTYNAVKNFTKGNIDLGTALLNIIPIAGAVGVAMYGMLGPTGLVIEGIALLVAGIMAYNQAQKELAEERALEKLFDGQGVSLDIIVDKFKKYNEETIRVGEKVEELSNNVEENSQAFYDSAEDIDYFLDKMNVTSGTISEEDIPKLKSAFETLSSSTKESIDNTVSILQNTLQAGMTRVADKVGVDADKIIDKYIEIQLAAGQEISKLDIQYKKIITNIQDRGHATEEEQQQIRDLVQEYAKFNPQISETKSIYDDLITQNFNKVNLGDPSKLKDNVNSLKEYKNELIEEANSTYKASLNEIDKMIALAEELGFSQEYIDSMKEDKKALGEALSINIKEIESQYGGTLATVLSQIVVDGADETDALKELVGTINEEIGKTGKNVDLTGEENKLFTKYFSTLQSDNNENLPKIIAMLSQLGIDIRGNFMNSVEFTETEKNILSQNFYNATQLTEEQRKAILSSIAVDGITIKDAQGNAIQFSEEEKANMSKILSSSYVVSYEDRAEILNKIISMGAEIKTSTGEAVTFTVDEKVAISKLISGGIGVTQTDWGFIMSASKKLGDSAVQSIIDGTYDKIPDLEKITKNTGSNIPVKIEAGINEKSSIPLEKAEEIISKLQTTSENKELIRKYLATGHNIDEGLANGLKEKMGIPEQEAINLANEIIEATKQALDSHSPSRKFHSIGEDSDQGLANGLKNKKDVVLNEARNIANELINIFRNMNLSFDIQFPDIRNSANSLISRFQTMLNNITSGLNTWLSRTTSSLNGLYIQDGKVKYSGISRVNIPRLAKGGIAYRPTYAQIGEAGREAVLPLENNTEWMDIFADKLAQKIGIEKTDNGSIVIYVTVDGEIIQKVVKKRQKKNDFATNGGN